MSNAPKTKLDYGKIYIELHHKGDGKYFSGALDGADVVVDLVRRTRPRRLLDYGSGKGYQYLVGRVHERWGGLLPVCYDVGVRQLAQRPEGTFDGVICTDMMEHIEECDVDAVLADIFSFVTGPSTIAGEVPADRSFVFLHISCIPSINSGKKRLPDGRNVHLTVKPPQWWQGKLERLRRPGLIIEARYEVERHGNTVSA